MQTTPSDYNHVDEVSDDLNDGSVKSIAIGNRLGIELNEAPLLKTLIENVGGMMSAMARMEDKLANLKAQGHIADRVFGEWSEEMPSITDNMEEV